MRYRLLVLFNAVLIAALMVVVSLPDHSMRGDLLNRSVQVGKLLAAVGGLAAALSFERGDYLRRAWSLLALNMFLLARDLPLAFVPRGASILGVPVDVVNQSIVVVANLVGLCSSWMMARAWQVAGLTPPGSPWRRRAIIGATLALALWITGIPLARSALAWLEGGPAPAYPVIHFVSGVGDTISICLIAPVLLTVLAMRGGVLVWPWGFYIAAMICWLLYDASDMASQLNILHGLRPGFYVARDPARVLACAFTFSSGLAQRFVVMGVQDTVPKKSQAYDE